MTGCVKISGGCQNCLHPDTPVLMADMSWRPISDVKEGDELVGFTESPDLGQNRLFLRSKVIRTWQTRAKAVEFSLDGRRLVDLGVPSNDIDVSSEPYLAGYLAGAIGGDGTMRIAGSGRKGTKQSYCRVAVLSDDRPILERMLQACEKLGITQVKIQPYDGGTGTFKPVNGRRPMSKLETRKISNLEIIRDQALAERSDLNWKAGFLAGFFDTDAL